MTKQAKKDEAKPAAKVEPKPEAKTKAPVVKQQTARHAAPTAKIEWLSKTNPKRAGSASHARASLYWGKPTVAEYLAAGGERADLAWDADHGFLAVKA